MVSLNHALNWVMDSENLYCAPDEPKPEHEMEKALSTTVDQISAAGILGAKIERGQIHFKIAQIKDNKAFKDKFPAALISIVSKQMGDMLIEKEILRTTGLPERLKVLEKFGDIRKIDQIIYDGEDYIIYYHYAEYSYLEKWIAALEWNTTVEIFPIKLIDKFVEEFFNSKKLVDDQIANNRANA